MIKLMIFITRRSDFSREEFRDYYEANHAPLACKLIPALARADYRRNFVRGDSPLADSLDFDVVTEITFDSEAHFQEFQRELSRSEVVAAIQADEAKFMERPKIRTVRVEVRK